LLCRKAVIELLLGLAGFGGCGAWLRLRCQQNLQSSCVFTGRPSQLLHENALQSDVTESTAISPVIYSSDAKRPLIAGGLLTVFRHRTPHW